jgi:carboxymethylenebutenolidase
MADTSRQGGIMQGLRFPLGSRLLRVMTSVLVVPILGVWAMAQVQAQELKGEVFPPTSGRGAIVVVVSGASGTPLYRDFSSKLAKLGYYTVLLEGRGVVIDPPGAGNLRAAIAKSQSAPQAIPGKVALVGLSMGGAAVLLHGAPLKDQVSAVVAYYPAITLFAPDATALAAKLQAPVLLFAGAQDQQGCCMIETMRALAAAPKTVPFELVVYPEAGHGFNLHAPQFVYRSQDADDAWSKAVAFLDRWHPPRGKRKTP